MIEQSKVQKHNNFLFKKLNPKITYPLIIIFGLIAIGISGYFVYQEKYKKVTTVQTKTEKTTLTIESEPAGVSMTGGSECDSSKMNKTTPYECEIVNIKETTIVAPEEVEINGEKFKFTTWDGCSESNDDKNICKITMSPYENKKIKANYEKLVNNNSSSSPNSSTNPPKQEASVSCAGGEESGNSCIFKIVAKDVPASFDIRADQVTPFNAIVNGRPLDVTCSSDTGCSYYDFNQQKYVPITNKENVANVSWRITEASTTVTIIADKIHTYTSNDGIARKWRFKKLVKNSYVNPDSTYDYISVQYDYISP